MIDFNQIESPVRITAKYILSKLEDHQIFRYYFGSFELGRNYSSKFRKDGTPSTGFYISKTGKLVYNDFRTAEKLDCFGFVAKLFNISYGDAVRRVAADFGLVGKPTKRADAIISHSADFDRTIRKNTLIQFIPGKWTTNRTKYWSLRYVDVSRLKKEEVYPVDRLFVNKIEIKVDELCFAYVVREKDKIYVKIYQPFSERMKWLSNIPLAVPFGMSSLKYGTDHVILGKAQKDRLILLTFFESIIGTQNESESALPDSLVKHLVFNFPQRTIIWDADETGVENCKKFNSKGFGYFNTPKQLLPDIKDTDEFVLDYGMHGLEKLLKSKNLL